ncbi:MAG: hypothetical protein Q9157_000652 [Trypethelium eluteriae]
MVKLAVIFPALLPFLTFVSATHHKHAQVSVRGFLGDDCENNHPGNRKVKPHEIENDNKCQHFDYSFKSFTVEKDLKRPWNPRNLNCSLDFFSDKKCRDRVSTQSVDNIQDDCTNVKDEDPNVTALAAKLNCQGYGDKPEVSVSTGFFSFAVGGLPASESTSSTTSSQSPTTLTTTLSVQPTSLSGFSWVGPLASSPTTPVCRLTTHTSTWTSCYVPSETTSVTTITSVDFSASPSVSYTTSTTTFMVAVPTTLSTTSSSIWTVQ